MHRTFPIMMLALGLVVGSSVAVAYANGGIDMFADVFIDGTLTVQDGTEGFGKVFTSDGIGKGSWQDIPSGSELSCDNELIIKTAIPAFELSPECILNLTANLEVVSLSPSGPQPLNQVIPLNVEIRNNGPDDTQFQITIIHSATDLNLINNNLGPGGTFIVPPGIVCSGINNIISVFSGHSSECTGNINSGDTLNLSIELFYLNSVYLNQDYLVEVTDLTVIAPVGGTAVDPITNNNMLGPITGDLV